MAFREIRIALSVGLLVAALAAAGQADWEFSTPEELGIDSTHLEDTRV